MVTVVYSAFEHHFHATVKYSIKIIDSESLATYLKPLFFDTPAFERKCKPFDKEVPSRKIVAVILDQRTICELQVSFTAGRGISAVTLQIAILKFSFTAKPSSTAMTIVRLFATTDMWFRQIIFIYHLREQQCTLDAIQSTKKKKKMSPNVPNVVGQRSQTSARQETRLTGAQSSRVQETKHDCLQLTI